MAKNKKFNKKSINKTAEKKETKINKSVTPSIAPHRLVHRSAESYLMSVGTKPHMIQAYVEWASRRGYTKATNAEWKEIFSKF